MSKRKIILIDQDKCNGCALCIPNCPEGAIQMIDQKARLVSDLFCDGLGACLGHCPQGAITIEEREAIAYNENRVMANIVKQGPNVIKAHLKHLQEHNELIYLKQAKDFLKEKKINIVLEQTFDQRSNMEGGCSGLRPANLTRTPTAKSDLLTLDQGSELAQWPVQLSLLPTHGLYFTDAHLLISADCVPFAYANFHQDLLKGKMLIVGCPKLDDLTLYREKLEKIFLNNEIKTVTYAHMEVPCCLGLLPIIKEAINGSGKKIPFAEITITIKGEKIKV